MDRKLIEVLCAPEKTLSLNEPDVYGRIISPAGNTDVENAENKKD